MSLETALLVASNAVDLSQLVKRRLLGADLGEPYALDRGETPEGLILDTYSRCATARDKNGPFLKRFDEAMGILLDEAILAWSHIVRAHKSNQERTDRRKELTEPFPSSYLLYSLRLCTVAERTSTPSDWRWFLSWAAVLFPHLQIDPAVNELFGRLIVSMGPALMQPEPGPKAFLLDAVFHEHAAVSVLRTLSVWNPSWLRSEVLPRFLAHYASLLSTDPGDSAITRALEDALFHMLASAESAQTRQALAGSLQQISLTLSDEIARKRLRHSIFAVLKKVGLSKNAFEFDNAYWTSLKDIDPWKDDSFRFAWDSMLESQKWSVAARRREARHREIVIGSPAFAEGALVLIYARVLESLLDIKSHVKTIGWGHVRDALLEGTIDLSFHNPLIGENKKLLRSKLIFTFVGYELIVRRAWLRHAIRTRTAKGKPSDLLVKILSGNPLRVQNPLKSKEVDEMRDLFTQATLAVPSRTDIEVKIATFLKMSDFKPRIIDLDEDTGAREIAIGEVEMYAGGANHAYYLTHEFPEECSKLAILQEQIAEGSPNRLIVKLGFERKFGISVSLLHSVWFEAIRIWRELVESVVQSRPFRLGNLPTEPIVEHILRNINSHTHGQFTSFRDLVTVLDEHTRFVEKGKAPEDIREAEKLMRKQIKQLSKKQVPITRIIQ